MHTPDHPFRVFLAEDSPLIRVSLIEHIEDLVPASVIAWREAEPESVDWLRSHPFGWDVAVLDLFLARGNGLAIAISLNDRPQSQKVVVLTNYATADIRSRCAAIGVDAVFDKSNELDEFTSYMQAYARQ